MNSTPKDTDPKIQLLSVIQPSSKELNKTNLKYYNPEVRVGDIYARFTKTILRGDIKAIVCAIENYYAEWTERNNGKLIGKYPEKAEVVLKALNNPINETNKDLVTENGNLLVKTFGIYLVVINDKFCIQGELRLSRSSYIVGERLNTLLASYKQAKPMLLNLKTIKTENDNGIWFIPDFSYTDIEADSEIVELADKFKKRINKNLHLINNLIKENSTTPSMQKLIDDLKIIIYECVKKFNKRYGVTGICKILLGNKLKKAAYNKNAIDSNYFGLLKMSNINKKTINDLINELINEGFLLKTSEFRPLLYINEAKT